MFWSNTSWSFCIWVSILLKTLAVLCQMWCHPCVCHSLCIRRSRWRKRRNIQTPEWYVTLKLMFTFCCHRFVILRELGSSKDLLELFNGIRDVNFREFYFSIREFFFLGLNKYSTDLSVSAKMLLLERRRHNITGVCLRHALDALVRGSRGDWRDVHSVLRGCLLHKEKDLDGRCW